MKIKKDYVVKTIGDDIVVVPIKDEAVRFNGIITLNKTGKFLFENLQASDLDKAELLRLILDKYDVSENKAKKDIDAFILKCKNNGLIDEESI
ncbi:MAG: PqqD family protein [Candidatus Izimaplasma sp.]|nr:PqqD family protein [Candidatus Izimaplasma bacterium]